MPHDLIISAKELATNLDNPNWLVADCRFALADPDEKEQFYQRAHIAGAIYVHLDRHLSAPIIPGVSGRHPLPSDEEAARRLGQLGIGPDMQVVAYDDAHGALAAARLWWMLRRLGHRSVAILDGGWQKWMEDDLPVGKGIETRPPQALPVSLPLEEFVTTDEIKQILLDPSYRVFDVRATERYRGIREPIDRIPGHIPGTYSAPYLHNTTPRGRFRSPKELRARYERWLGEIPAERTVFYCGSGVTSAHSLLALQLAGLGNGRLYPGSYSEWVADPERPVNTGPNP